MRTLLIHLAAAALAAAKTPVFQTSDASAAGSVTGFEFKKRVVVPYGVGESCVGGTDAGNCTAFGFGGAEQSAYDAAEKLVYAVSEQNSIAVVDATTMEWKVSWSAGAVGALTSAKVCGGKLYVAAAADVKTDDGSVLVYDTVKRSDMTTAPTLLQTVTVGPLPDMILPNGACTILAVANEGEGKQDDAGVLVDPVGSVDLVDLATYAVSRVDFAGLAATDADLEAKGVDQLMSLASMTYFNDHSYIKDALDWDTAIAAYTPATQLEPEYLAWSGDDATVYVNLQENSAVVAVDAATATAADVFGLGLKSWAATKIDTVKDGECILATKPGFATMRMPDSIAAFTLDGKDYLLFAEEGDDYTYGDFEDKQKFKDVIKNATAFEDDFADFVAGAGMADAFSNFGDTSMRVSIGPRAVDYSDPAAPVFEAAVGYGGRGISIYEASPTALTWVWDSGSAFEENVCQYYPWAFNGIQDEEFALTRAPGGYLYNSLPAGDGLIETLDEMNDPDEDGCADAGDGQPGACPLGGTVDERSLKDGAGTEAMTVGVACGRLVAVTATEKSGVLMAYDVTDPTAPAFIAAQHASPASETMSPEVAMAQGVLGDIDTESIIFVDAADSPTGNAGILVAGAWSSTLSWWEFTCDSALGSGSDGAQGWTARAAAAAAALAVAAL